MTQYKRIFWSTLLTGVFCHSLSAVVDATTLVWALGLLFTSIALLTAVVGWAA